MKIFQIRQAFTFWNPVSTLQFLHFRYAMNALFKERHNHSKICIIVKLFRRRQLVEIYLQNENIGLFAFGKNCGHILGSIDGNDFGLLMRGEGFYK